MQHPSDMSEDDLKAFSVALLDDPHGEDDELLLEEGEGSDISSGAERSGITSHVLRCKQGLNNAYVYDDSTFLPPATGEVFTRVAFYDGNLNRLLLSAWRSMGGGNPYRTIVHRWTWKSTQVKRSLVLWYENGYHWSSWAGC